MSNPPDIPASELWLRLSETPAPSDIVDFPRYDADGKPIGKVRMIVATMEQLERCRIRARDGILAKYKWDNEEQRQAIPTEVIGDAVAREILHYVCHDANGTARDDGTVAYPKLFPDPESLKKLLPDEIAVLWATYQMVEAKFGPRLGHLTRAQVEAWVTKLAEGAGTYPLALLDLPQRDYLTVTLATTLHSVSNLLARHSETLPSALVSDLQTLPIDISSFGEPPSDGYETLQDAPITLEMAQEAVRGGRLPE